MTDTPYITAEALVTVVSRMADTAFRGADTAVTANFPGHEPSVEFAMAHPPASEYLGARGRFLTLVGKNAETIAENLEEARNLCREDSLDRPVAVELPGSDASWPMLTITVRPAA